MKKIKSIITAFALCALYAETFAQHVTVADVEALPGETVAFTLNLTDGKVDTYSAMQFEAHFPASGFAMTGKYSVSQLWENAMAVVGDIDINGTATIPVASSETIGAADVEGLLTIFFTVDSDVNYGEYDVTLTNLWFGYGMSSKDYLADVSFKVNVVEHHAIILDETSTTAPTAATDVNVLVKRTINAGEWSTICLPFAMTEAQCKTAFGSDVQLGDFTGYVYDEDADKITVNFSDVTAIEANHPYIIKVSSPVTEFTVDAVDIAPEEEPTKAAVTRTKKQWSEMIGTYVAETEIEEASLFLSGNKFWYSNGNTKMKAFRAYFDFYDELENKSVSSARITLGFDDATRISDATRLTYGSEMYNLSGQRVDTPKKGVYVKGSKKVFMK